MVKHCVHSIRSRCICRFDEPCVNIRCRAGLSVSKPSGNRDDGNMSRYQQAGVCMAQAVDSDRRRASGRTAPVMREARYYPTLENAVQGAANSALRDCIASDEVQSLHDAVEALRTISKEIRAAVSVLDTNTAGK